MDYRYNFRFLDTWMSKNNMKRKDLLAAFGTQDFKSVNQWRDGVRALPLGMLLRMCNTFQIPLEQWFFDYDETPAQPVRKPTSNDRTEPTGGYLADNERNNRQGMNPKARFTQASDMPDEYPLPTEVITSDKKGGSENKESTTPFIKEDTPPLLKESMEMLRLKISTQKQIMDIQQRAREHEDSIRSEFMKRNEKLREKLYAIIEKQQTLIEKQQETIDKLSNKQQTKKVQAYPRPYDGTIAADGLPTEQKKPV